MYVKNSFIHGIRKMIVDEFVEEGEMFDF